MLSKNSQAIPQAKLFTLGFHVVYGVIPETASASEMYCKRSCPDFCNLFHAGELIVLSQTCGDCL